LEVTSNSFLWYVSSASAILKTQNDNYYLSLAGPLRNSVYGMMLTLPILLESSSHILLY
jgi:hypothetical protein